MGESRGPGSFVPSFRRDPVGAALFCLAIFSLVSALEVDCVRAWLLRDETNCEIRIVPMLVPLGLLVGWFTWTWLRRAKVPDPVELCRQRVGAYWVLVVAALISGAGSTITAWLVWHSFGRYASATTLDQIWIGAIMPEALRAALCIVAVVLLLRVLPKATRELRRARGRCQHCGYDLTGNVSGVCPECGTPTPAGGPRPPAPTEPRP